MARHPVHVILPCAGRGMRMNLPFPKELAPLGPGRCLIDSSLDLIRNAGALCDIRIILMSDGKREATARYVRDRLPWVPVAEVRQAEGARDMPEAVLALEPWFAAANVLLLPDVIYSWHGDPVTEITAKVADHGFAAAAAKAGPEEIRSAGALRIGDLGQVEAYEDKPADPAGYNALWGMLAFSSMPHGLSGMRLIAESTSRARTGPVTERPVRGAPVTWLDGFRDCGTWDAYLAEVRRSLV
jgi:hypothetical protein